MGITLLRLGDLPVADPRFSLADSPGDSTLLANGGLCIAKRTKERNDLIGIRSVFVGRLLKLAF